MSNTLYTQHLTLNTADLSPESKFLITCCQTEISEEDISFIHHTLSTMDHTPSENALGVQQLTVMSSRHGVLPLVYKTIKNLPTDYNPLLTELKAKYISIAQRNMSMTSELIKIIHLLKENKIEALAFKGPALAQMAYGDITLRQFGDLDILIKKRDRSQMIDLLLKENYIPEIDLKEGTKETFLKSVNVIAFYKRSTGIRVEIHWELLSRNYAIDWEEGTLWHKQGSTQINHKKIPVLPVEQQLLYLCAHGAKHLFERLEWICDIDRSIRSNPDIDWQHLMNEAKKLGIKRMLYLGLALSQQFFGTKLPEMTQEDIVQDKEIVKLISKVIEINFSETSQEGKSYSSFGLLWSMRENLSDQLRFAWRGLFAPKFDDFMFVQLPKHLAFLYPLVRPYRLVIKYFNPQ